MSGVSGDQAGDYTNKSSGYASKGNQSFGSYVGGINFDELNDVPSWGAQWTSPGFGASSQSATGGASRWRWGKYASLIDFFNSSQSSGQPFIALAGPKTGGEFGGSVAGPLKVPLPPVAWLFASGLLPVLFKIRRRSGVS